MSSMSSILCYACWDIDERVMCIWQTCRHTARQTLPSWLMPITSKTHIRTGVALKRMKNSATQSVLWWFSMHRVSIYLWIKWLQTIPAVILYCGVSNIVVRIWKQIIVTACFIRCVIPSCAVLHWKTLIICSHALYSSCSDCRRLTVLIFREVERTILNCGK